MNHIISSCADNVENKIIYKSVSKSFRDKFVYQNIFFVQGLDAQTSDCCVLRKITPLQAGWHFPSKSVIPDLTSYLVTTGFVLQMHFY